MNRFGLRILRAAFSWKQWFLFRLTRAGQLVAAGIAVSAVFGLNTHANLAHQIFCFLALLAAFSVFAGRRGDIRLSLLRRLPRHATVGQPFSYRLWISNHRTKPLTDLVFREVIDTERFLSGDGTPSASEGSRLSGRDRLSWLAYWRKRSRYLPPPPQGQAAVGQLGANARQDVTITIEPRMRGRIDFTGIAVHRSDPLGLFRSETRFDQAGSVVVLPKRYRLPQVVLPGRRHFQPGGVALASSVGDSEEFVSLRDYRPGDPLRRIHWKSWAKTGKPVVKEYQEEYFVRHALVLDTFHSGPDDRFFEEAVSLAASFVSAAQSETLLDLMFVGPEAYCFTCGRGLTHTDKMLEILSGVTACSDRSFEDLLPLVLQRAAQLSACICVLLAWDEHRRRLVGMLRQLNVPVEVFVLTADGKSDPEPGPMQDRPHRFHALASGRVQEELNRL